MEVEKSFRDIVLIFFSRISEIFARKTRNLMKLSARKLMRIMIVSFAFLLGIIFLLDGIAILVNESLKIGNWPGYALVGFILMIVGLAFKNEQIN